DAWPTVGLAVVLTHRIGVSGASACAFLGLALLRRGKGNARSPGLREADGDGLLRRSCPLLAAGVLVNFPAHELARLRRGRLARTLGLLGFLDCSLVGHLHSP